MREKCESPNSINGGLSGFVTSSGEGLVNYVRKISEKGACDLADQEEMVCKNHLVIWEYGPYIDQKSPPIPTGKT